MLKLLLAAVVLMILVVVGLGASAAFLRSRVLVPAQQSVPNQGSATEFGRGPVGFKVTVTDVRIPASRGTLSLSVSFLNTSSEQQRADPRDFALRDAQGERSRPVLDAGCPRWTRADLHPSGGGSQAPRDSDAQQVGTTFGPVPLCFAVAHPAERGLQLIWDPDIGLLGTPVAIQLP